MKASELRIGGYYFKEGNYPECVFMMTREELAEILKIGGEYNYSSITLTEERLLKLGFRKDSGGDLILVFGNCRDLSWVVNSKEMFLTCGQFAEMSEVIPCKYVHQLQNLYFALTGEELTIKQ